MLDTEILRDDEPFDLMVSNPPYVTPDEYQTLIPCVRDYEDKMAVFGSESNSCGMQYHKAIVELAKRHLRGGEQINGPVNPSFPDIPRVRLDEVAQNTTHLPRVSLEFSGKNRRYAVIDLADRSSVPTTIWKDFRDKDRLMTVDI